MTGQADPYVRVYYSVTYDDKFRGVYRDDALLGCWLRLLIIADGMHPAPAHLPHGVDMDRVEKLVECGLVDMIGDGLYVIHGLASERSRRSQAARSNASKRWGKTADATAMRPHSGGNATAMRPHTGSDATAMRPHSASDATALLTEPSLTEPNRAEPMPGDPTDDADHLDAWLRLTGSWPSPRVTPWLDRLATDHGAGELISALATEWTADPDRSTVLGRAETRLRRDAHERRKSYERAAANRAAREREQIEEMPAEQRQANMARLREEMAKAGLLPREEAA